MVSPSSCLGIKTTLLLRPLSLTPKGGLYIKIRLYIPTWSIAEARLVINIQSRAFGERPSRLDKDNFWFPLNWFHFSMCSKINQQCVLDSDQQISLKDGEKAELPCRVTFMRIGLWVRAVYKGKHDDQVSFIHVSRTREHHKITGKLSSSPFYAPTSHW